MNKNELSTYLENITLVLFGVLFFAFPLAFTTQLTDFFTFPKEALVGVVALLGLVFFGVRILSEGSVRIRRTPFDVAVGAFVLVAIVSAVFSVNQYDSLIAAVPLVFAAIAYWVVVNTFKTESSLMLLVSSAILGAVLVAAVSALSYAKQYIIPLESTKFQTFTPLGSLVDQAVYLALMLPLAIYFALPLFTTKHIKTLNVKALVFTIAATAIAGGLGLTIYMLVKVAPPQLLPFQVGFQTAFAAISQDNPRLFQGFLFGSGFGTYATDFTRFKPASFNLYENLWFITFFRSSSFVLEVLATMGVVGLLSFLYLVYKIVTSASIDRSEKGLYAASMHTIRENPLFLPVVLLAITAFLLYFSPTIMMIFFLLLGVYAASEGLRRPAKYYDIELRMVSSKRSFLPFTASVVGDHHRPVVENTYTRILPVITMAIIVVITGVLGYFSTLFIMADRLFQQSLVAASQNDGGRAYDLQNRAIGMFPWRDGYYRIFSQLNISLANSLAAQQPTAGQQPSQQVQQLTLQLIQQAIASARSATTTSPYTASNWENLAAVYRSLIGFGQNAEQFAVASGQQAALLDPNNPQQYINLGGIFYQLQQWDQAQQQFQIAVNLKPDYANAYYNLGHALESQGNGQAALQQYEIVKQLIAANKENVKQIDEEIQTLQKKLGEKGGQPAANAEAQGSDESNQPLGIATPAAKLPAQKEKVEIQAPPATPAVATPTPSPAPSGTPAPTRGQ